VYSESENRNKNKVRERAIVDVCLSKGTGQLIERNLRAQKGQRSRADDGWEQRKHKKQEMVFVRQRREQRQKDICS